MKRVLCILEDGFEEIEAVTPIDLLRRADVEVVLAGVSVTTVMGKCGIRIKADVLLDDISGKDFDAIFLPGGPAVVEMRKNPKVIDLIREFSENEKLIAAICAAPLLLNDAGILEGKNFTAHFSTKKELPNSLDHRVIYDTNLLTSQGAGTALDFGLALVEILAGTTVKNHVSKAVMY